MSLKNQKGIVRYQGRDDIVCAYGIRDDGVQFYYLDSEGKPLKNGYYIATTALVEAVDPMVKASNVGLIDGEGKEIIPFTNRSIRIVNDDIILVEPAIPTTQSVIEAIQLKSDPLSATKLVSTPALIKEKLNAKVGENGRYLFNDQFSEATLCDINGNNLVDGASYSFIVSDGKTLYFSKNTADSEITSYSILPPEVQSDVTADNTLQAIDVNNVSVPQEVVENALSSSEDVGLADSAKGQDAKGIEENVSASAEVTPPVEEAVQASPAKEIMESSNDNVPIAEAPAQDSVQDTNMETGFEIPNVDVDVPNLPSEVVPPVVDNRDEEEVKNVIPSNENVPVDENIAEADEPSVADESDGVSISEEEVNEVSVPDTVVENSVEENIPSDDKEEDKSNENSLSDIPEAVNETENSDEDNTIEEKNDSDLEPDVAFENTLLDDDDDIALNITSDSYDDIDDDVSESNNDLDDIDDDVDDEFDNSHVQIDHIDSNVNDEFEGGEYHENIVPDAIRSLNALMNKVQVVEANLSEEQAKNNKLNASRRTLKEKNQALSKKVEIYYDKIQALEAQNAQLSSKVSLLEERNHAQDGVIKAQSQELQHLRPLQQGTEELFNVVASVQDFLEESSSSKTR